jgi:quinol monooxygenase YgiN
MMVLARVTIWRFKQGTREAAFLELDNFLNTSTRHAEGFRGYMSMFSTDDPNIATTLTLWQDEDSLKTSETGVFVETIQKIQGCLDGEPKTDTYRVFSTELFMRNEPEAP